MELGTIAENQSKKLSQAIQGQKKNRKRSVCYCLLGWETKRP